MFFPKVVEAPLPLIYPTRKEISQVHTETMSDQKTIFLIAERRLFGKKGGSKLQSDTIRYNRAAIRQALKCPQDSKGIQRFHATKTILAALNGRGWKHQRVAATIRATQEGQAIGETCSLSRYGGLTVLPGGRKKFVIRDKRLKTIWDAIPRFISKFSERLGLRGDKLIQQATILVILNHRYQQWLEVQEAESLARNAELKEEAKKARELLAKKERAAREKREKAEAEKAQQEELSSTLADLEGSFGEWDDDEEERAEIEDHYHAQAEAEKAAAEAKRLAKEQEKREQREFLESLMTQKAAPKASEQEDQEDGKKKKKKKKSHQVRKMEAAKKKKKKKAGKR